MSRRARYIFPETVYPGWNSWNSDYDWLCAIFWTRRDGGSYPGPGLLTCVSKTDYPLREREPCWILGRDSSRLFSTSTGLIMAPPRPCAWEMLPYLSPRSLPTSSLLSRSFGADRSRTGSGRSPYLFYRPAGHSNLFSSGMSAEAFPLSTFSLSFSLYL